MKICAMKRLCMATAVAFALPLSCLSAPDAGQLLNEQDTVRRLPQTLPEREGAVRNEAANANDGARLEVERFRFLDTHGLATEDELRSVLGEPGGGDYTFGELQALVDGLTAYLRSKGYLLARAYLPKQEIVSGVVNIAFISGEAEGVPALQMESGTRTRRSFLESMVAKGAYAGEPLRTDELERSVLLLNDLPAVAARSILERGVRPGTTSVAMQVEEGRLADGMVMLDTFGNRYTGELRGTGIVSFNGLGGFADRLTLDVTGSEGLRKGGVSYQLPLGSDGWVSRLSYTGLEYELGEEYATAEIEGVAHSISADVVYPWIRSRTLSVWQGMQFSYRRLEDDVLGEELRDRALNTVSTNLKLERMDRFGGGGLTTASLQVTAGDLELHVASDAFADAATAGTEGGYAKLGYAASRLQRLTEQDTFFGAVSGQLASGNLDSSEKFALGGPNGVRAYPIGEGTADEGFSVTAEWRHDFPSDVFGFRMQLVGFWDAGYARLHKDAWRNSITTATGDNGYWISGAGLGLNVSRTNGFTLRSSVARTLGDNPGRNLYGNNADNRDDDVRLWIQTLFWF